jgi:hypothetical protein
MRFTLVEHDFDQLSLEDLVEALRRAASSRWPAKGVWGGGTASAPQEVEGVLTALVCSRGAIHLHVETARRVVSAIGDLGRRERQIREGLEISPHRRLTDQKVQK